MILTSDAIEKGELTVLPEQASTAAAEVQQYNEQAEKNRLVYVGRGTTEISMHYPYLVQGVLMSAFGILAAAVFSIFVKPREKKGGRFRTKQEE